MERASNGERQRIVAAHGARGAPRLRRLPAALLAAGLGLGVAASAWGQGVPGAGSILQEVRPEVPPAPVPARPGVTIEAPGAAGLPPTAPFLIKSLRISGNTVFDTATLHALIAEGEGKTLSLPQLGELVGRISAYYQERGYLLARAIIPAQAIRDGVVEIQVIEARYGQVRIDNSSAVQDGLLRDTTRPLQPGEVIRQEPLDRALLLLSDVPGAVVNGTLRPGAEVGTSDLMINAAAGPRIAGNLIADNFGNRFTGRERLAGTLNLLNPLGRGDYLSLNVMTSGSGLNYGRLLYDTLLNGYGTRAGASYSTLHYRLGETLSAIKAHGTADVASLWARQPLLRNARYNLTAQLQFDNTKLRDHVDLTSTRTDRHLDSLHLSLTGDARYQLFGGAINTWSLRYTAGRLGFDDPTAQLVDALTVKTAGQFSKWNIGFTHLQRLGASTNLYFSFAGQWANDNLDSSQKMVVAGPYAVRAYDVGALSGDNAQLATLELRQQLGSWMGQWQAVAFFDTAHVTTNRQPWVTGTNSANLNGAGLGLNWSGPHRISARVFAATRVGSAPALLPNAGRGRGWVEVSWAF